MDGSIKLGIIQDALGKMFRAGGYFDVTRIRELAKLVGVEIPKETETAMSALHCVDFAAMQPKTRTWLAQAIDDLFSNPDNLTANYQPRILRSRIAISGNAFLIPGGKEDGQ